MFQEWWPKIVKIRPHELELRRFKWKWLCAWLLTVHGPLLHCSIVLHNNLNDKSSLNLIESACFFYSFINCILLLSLRHMNTPIKTSCQTNNWTAQASHVIVTNIQRRVRYDVQWLHTRQIVQYHLSPNTTCIYKSDNSVLIDGKHDSMCYIHMHVVQSGFHTMFTEVWAQMWIERFCKIFNVF